MSMIKINLLPRTIDQKRVVRNTAILMGIILLLIIGSGVAYSIRLQAKVDEMEKLAAETEAWKARVENIQKQAQEVRSQIEPIKQKLDFINKVLQYNLEFPKLYEEIAKWTYEKIQLTSLQCDGQQVVMQAYAKDLDDLGRYLLNMYRAVDLFSEVTISGIPGYKQAAGQGGGVAPTAQPPAGGQISGSMAPLAGIQAIQVGVQRAEAAGYAPSGITFTVTCKLKKPIVAPQFSGGAQAGQPGQPGAPTGGPMMPAEPMAAEPMAGPPGAPPGAPPPGAPGAGGPPAGM
ncbi:MAG: PilN domain-containing protein [Armatimonadota bacterium]|nr:PilN domain-containing protein [Armatimonadota bacterium]